MNNTKRLAFVGALALAIAAGCAHDPNQPATLQQQQNMAKGYQPTQEQLAAEMSRYKTPGPGTAQPTPGSGGTAGGQ